MRLNFEKLPLIETAVRAGFDPPVQLSFATLSKIGGFLAERGFPKICEAANLESPPGFPFQPPKGLPGAAIFAGHENGIEASVQTQMVAARWLKRRTADADYPRFEVLEAALWDADEAFRTASPEAPPIAVVNMTYVNFIQSEEPVDVLRNYFSKRVHVPILEDAAEFQGITVAWRESDGIDLRFELNAASLNLGAEPSDGLRLLTAGGLRFSNETPKSALGRVHDRMQDFFLDLLSKKAEDEWLLKRQD